MKNLSNLISLMCLFFAISSYGQSTINWPTNNRNEEVTSKQGVMSANWLIESLVIEIAWHDFYKNNNIESAYLLSQSVLKKNKSSKLFEANNNSLATLNLMECVVLKRFHAKGQELKGTAPIHLIPEKYPQEVSAVPPKFFLPTGLGEINPYSLRF